MSCQVSKKIKSSNKINLSENMRPETIKEEIPKGNNTNPKKTSMIIIDIPKINQAYGWNNQYEKDVYISILLP